MTRTEPVQVKYTNRLKAAQCFLCYYQNLLNQLSWFYNKKAYVGHTEAIESLLILRCIRGTGMIASSSTFCPHPGRVIRDLFRLLDAVMALYGSTSLQQSSKGSCSLLVSGYNLRADCQWRTLVPPLNSGANAAPASVLALM